MLSVETLKKLEQRQVELAEIFIAETDASKWPGDDTQKNRGDRYWHKRNAGATAGLIVKIQSILDVALKKAPIADPTEPVPGGAEEEEEAPEAMAAAATAEAQRIIDRHQGRFRKKK